MHGYAMLYRNVGKKTFVQRIKEYDRRWWRNGFGMNERVFTSEESTQK